MLGNQIRLCGKAKTIVILGSSLILVGLLGLLVGLTGFVDLQYFSFGLSSGLRVIGSIVILGCLLNVIGYGIQEFVNDNFENRG